MAVTYKKDVNGQRVVIHANANTGNIVVAGNNTVSNLTANATEIVVGGVITKVIYGAQGSGYWMVYRGANVVGTYVNSGVVHYSQEGMVLDVDPTANLTANLVGTTNGSIMIEVKKTY